MLKWICWIFHSKYWVQCGNSPLDYSSPSVDFIMKSAHMCTKCKRRFLLERSLFEEDRQ